MKNDIQSQELLTFKNTPYSQFVFCILLCSAFLAFIKPAHADQIDNRIGQLNNSFTKEMPSAQWWEYGWLTFNSTTSMWNIYEATRDKKHKDRNVDIIEASEGILGIADLLFRPLPVLRADEACEDDAAAHNRQTCLAEMEAIASAEQARWHQRYEFFPHAAIVGANLIAGSLSWRFGSFARGLATAVPGIIIGEIQLWTIPSGVAHRYDAYKVTFKPMPQLSDNPKDTIYGVHLGVAF